MALESLGERFFHFPTPSLYPLQNMKVMLFAAGLGTRLKPITDTMPKAMVPVDGRPLLDITLTNLVKAGATEVVVNVHHFAEQIIAYVQKHDWGVPVKISDERACLLDTGGGLLHAASLFSSDEAPILIHNVDILSNVDLRAFYQAHQDDDAALLVSERDTQRYLLFDEEMRLKGWTNLAKGLVRLSSPELRADKLARYAFSGIHCFSPRLFAYMREFGEKFPIMEFYLQVCGRVSIKGCLKRDLRLLDVGKLDTLRAAEDFVRQYRL